MTDFEERLISSLRSAGADAPDAAGLAPAARVRARSRRRRTALASAVSVVAVAAVVGGVALLGSGGEGTPDRVAAADDPTTAPTAGGLARPRVRAETWRDLSVTVPASWGYGTLDDWCAAEGDGRRPVVQRPGAVSVDILCDPGLGYGVEFLDASAFDFARQPGEVWQYTGGDVALYPTDAWLGYQQAGDNVVRVVAPTRSEAEQVLGSFARLGDDDPDGNACLPRSGAGNVGVPDGQVRLCRYGSDGWLEQSELLTEQDARDAVAALEAAPVEEMASCAIPRHMARVEVTAGQDVGNVEISATCQGFSWGDQWHPLTADVLHWVLSPGWSGQVPDDIRFQPRS